MPFLTTNQILNQTILSPDDIQIDDNLFANNQSTPKIKKRYKWAGWIIAMIFAVGTCITGLGGIAGLLSGMTFLIVAPLLGLAAPIANFIMTKKAAPKIISLGFINLFKTEDPTLNFFIVSAVHQKKLKKFIIEVLNKYKIESDITDIVVTRKIPNSPHLNLSIAFKESNRELIKVLRPLLQEKIHAKFSNISEPTFISPLKCFMLAIGILLSIGFGTAIGALTFASVVALPTVFTFLTAGAPLVVVGVIIGTVTVFCLASLMMKTFADFIKTPNIKQKILKIFSKNENETTFRYRARIALITVLGGGATLLAMYGVFSMLVSSTPGLSDILIKIPGASEKIVNVASLAITQGVAFLAQVPFIFQTSFGTITSVINKIFTPTPNNPNENNAENSPLQTRPPSIYKKITSAATSVINLIPATIYMGMFAFNAITNGFLSIHGQSLGISSILEGIGGTINSFFGPVANAMSGKQKKPKTTLPNNNNKSQNSTAFIANQLNIDSETQIHSELSETSFNGRQSPSSLTRPNNSDINLSPTAENINNRRKLSFRV